MSTNRSGKNKFPKSLKRKVLKAQNSVCGVCGCTIDIVTADPHHIIPVCQGGSTNRENLLMVCRPCHIGLHKGDS